MAPLLYNVFSTPRYKPLEDSFKFGLNEDLDLKDPEVKKKIQKQKIIPLCARAEILLTDEEFWESLESIVAPFRLLKFRQFLFGNIMKGIFIIHKERVKKVYGLCKMWNFLRIFRRSFNKKYDKVVMVKKIRPEIPNLNPPARFQRSDNEDIFNSLVQDIREALDDTEQRIVPTQETVRADRHPDAGAMPIEHFPTEVYIPTDRDTIPMQMDIVPDIEPHPELLVGPGSRSVQLPEIFEEIIPQIPVRRFPMVEEDSPPGPLEPIVFEVQAQVHYYETSPDPSQAVAAGGRTDEAPMLEHPSADVPSAVETVARASEPMDIVSEISSDIVREPIGICIDQVDQIVAEIAEQDRNSIAVNRNRMMALSQRILLSKPREVVHTRIDTDRNMEELEKDWNRLELVSTDEVPTAKPDQPVQIPGIVVIPSDRTQTDLTVDREVVRDSDVPLEITSQRIRPGERRVIRVSDLMRDDTPRRVKRKTPVKKVPIAYTREQMQRMIKRPLIKNPVPATAAAEVYVECRPDVLNPLRMLSRSSIDIHDIWEAPKDYANEMKKNKMKEYKLSLLQIVSFCHGHIFQRFKTNPSATAEEEKKEREMGYKAMRTIVNFPKIPTPLILRFNASDSENRPSFRPATDQQPVNILGSVEKYSIHEATRKSEKSLLPAVDMPSFPRISVQPHLAAGEGLDGSLQVDNIIVPIEPTLQAHGPVPEDLNRLEVVQEPKLSVQAHAVATRDLDRIEVVQEPRLSVQAHAAATRDLDRIDVVQEPRLSVQAHTAAARGDLDRIEIVQEPPLEQAHVAAPREDLYRLEIIDEYLTEVREQRSLTRSEIAPERREVVRPSLENSHLEISGRPREGDLAASIVQPPVVEEETEPSFIRPRRILTSDVLGKLKVLFNRKVEPIKFVDLCHPNSATRLEAAKTFRILLELHAQKQIHLENEVEGLSSSPMLIYSK